MISEDEVRIIRAWSQKVEVEQEFTLDGISEKLDSGRAKRIGSELREAVERREPHVRFLRLAGYNAEGQPLKTGSHHIRYVRLE